MMRDCRKCVHCCPEAAEEPGRVFGRPRQERIDPMETIVDETGATTGRLVRCADCANAKLRPKDGFFVCEFWTAFACDSGKILMPADGFCHNGEAAGDEH